MNNRFIILRYILVLGLTPFLSSAVKQVRVTAERASIYADPSRGSSRIDIVEKGTVLNLFQQNKIKDVWYYVSYSSPRYGTRISGFIHESFVELVAEEGAFLPKKEEVEKPAQPPSKVEEKKEVKVEPGPIPKTEVSLVLTALPKSQTFKFPRKERQRQERVWKEVIKVEEFAVLTAPLRPRSLSLPRREKAIEDAAWKVLPRVKEEKKKPAEKALVEAPKTTKLPSVQPGRIIVPRKGRGILTLGLGYGSSFGGAGGFIQLNTRPGIAFHGGVGMYPTKLIYSETDWVKNKVLYSVGVKYYLPFKPNSVYPYLDLQYGGLTVEAAQIVMSIGESSYVYSREQKTLWGPSFLAGTEIRMGRFGINGALGISYNMTEWEFQKRKLLLAFEASLVVYF